MVAIVIIMCPVRLGTEALKEVGDVIVKEDKEDEEMVKQVGRKVVMVIIMCPVRSGTTQQAYTVHGQ